MGISKIIPGEKYNRLTIIQEVETKNYRRRVECRCDCGNQSIILMSNLTMNRTKSCGCLNMENKKNNVKHSHTINGLITSEYTAWVNMRNRCYNSKNNRFQHYGGRGITVCDRWLKSFKNFINDMGLKPTPLHSIDRIDVNGNYEPSNCKWSTPQEQANNKRNNIT
jgi:hypothetical protein